MLMEMPETFIVTASRETKARVTRGAQIETSAAALMAVKEQVRTTTVTSESDCVAVADNHVQVAEPEESTGKLTFQRWMVTLRSSAAPRLMDFTDMLVTVRTTFSRIVPDPEVEFIQVASTQSCR
jgi:hypothetical protein